MKLEHTSMPYLKWLKDLNIRHDTIKLLEENIGKIVSDINDSNVFPGQYPKTNINKCKNKQMGPNQTDKICTAKEMIKKKKEKKTIYRIGENICKQCNQQRFNFKNIQITHTTQ